MKNQPSQTKYYYSTRDLLLMAALAALGGIASTYVNFVGDFFQSFLGFSGTNQWAAGLHVLWLILAVGLTRKQGAGTITGILKGAVELFTGNTHGLLIVLVDVTAGILVDLVMFPFRRRDHWLPYAFAGGIASASNVFVFQLFAVVPADILTYGVIGLISLVACLSGVVFAGILGWILLATLRRSGVVKDQQPQPVNRNVLSILMVGAVLLAGGIYGSLKISRTGSGVVAVSGSVSSPYSFTVKNTTLQEKQVEISQGGFVTSYRGYPLKAIIESANPEPDVNYISLRASDGYTFYITVEELSRNENMLLQVQGQGKNLLYNLVGPESKKAWVSGLVEISLMKTRDLVILINGQEQLFNAADWTNEMDSTLLDVGFSSKKYQGVPLKFVLESGSIPEVYTNVVLTGQGGTQLVLPAQQVWSDEGIRIFIILDGGDLSYTVAHLDGSVYLNGVEQISLQ